jgi:hypothetical protein
VVALYFEFYLDADLPFVQDAGKIATNNFATISCTACNETSTVLSVFYKKYLISSDGLEEFED